MKGKAKATAKFGATDIRQLPPELRTDRKARAAVAARKRVIQAKYVLEQEETAAMDRAKRVTAAKKELEAAEADFVKAEKAAG